MNLSHNRIKDARQISHLKTLEELNFEARELFFENGGKTFQYIPCLNDNEYSIKFLNEIVKQNLLGWNN